MWAHARAFTLAYECISIHPHATQNKEKTKRNRAKYEQQQRTIQLQLNQSSNAQFFFSGVSLSNGHSLHFRSIKFRYFVCFILDLKKKTIKYFFFGKFPSISDLFSLSALCISFPVLLIKRFFYRFKLCQCKRLATNCRTYFFWCTIINFHNWT